MVSDTLTVGDLNVDVSINHTYASDLRLRLRSPDGTWVTLVQRRGGAATICKLSLMMKLLVRLQQHQAISQGPSGRSGLFRHLMAKPPKETWVLEVADLAALDVGTLNHVTLKITPTTTTSSISNSDALAARMWIG